jgi:flagellar hook-associated protein 2
MVTAPKFTFAGISSGLDTDAMVTAIMNAERIPQSRLKVKKAEIDVKQAAWANITAKLAEIRTAADALKSRTAFDGFVTATSSDEDAVKVTATSGAVAQATTFTVSSLAAAHQVSAGTYSSGTSLVGAGTFTITRAGSAHDYTTTASTTLDQLAAQINGDTTAGVSASVIKVADGDTRLVLSARESGAANVFTATGTQTGLGASTINRPGTDAVLTMGTLEIRRSSNRITDLVKGVTIDLKKVSADPVTITTDRDADKATAAVKKLVDATNAAITQLKELTKYDPESKTAGQLQNDSSARSLSAKLIRGMSDLVAGLTGDTTSATSVGVSIQRDGTYKLDEAKFKKALAADFDGVAALFARAGSATDPRVSFVTATGKSAVGAHTVSITQAASAPGITGSAYSIPGADETISILVGSKTIDVTLAAGDTLSAAVSKINTALGDNDVFDVVASADSGALRLGSTSYGAGSTFSVSGASSFGLDGSYAGTDVVGTIDGAAATGSGQTLSGATGTGAEGLIVRVTASQSEVAGAGGTLALGSLTYSEGLAGRLLGVLDLITGANGTVDLAKKRYENQEKLVDQRISEFDNRLAIREATLRRQFTSMETALANLQSQQSYLGSALGSLPQG